MFGAVYFAQSYLYFALQADSAAPQDIPGVTPPTVPPTVASPQLFDTAVIPSSFRVDGRTTQESLY